MQQLTLKCAGLYSFPNPLGTVPPGALLNAQNGVIDRTDTFETRRGMNQYGTALSAPFQEMYNFNSTLMGWDGTNFWYDSDGAGTWSELTGNYLAPTGTYRIKGIEAQGSMYFGTSTGVISLTAPNSTFLPAGVPYPLDSTAALTEVSGGFMANDVTVGYRMIIGYTDTNNQLHPSAPSQRLVVTNTGTASSVTLTWYLPDADISAGYYYQIGRTKQTAFVSSVPQDPGDEEYLVVQKTLTSADISNGYVTYTDNIPDALLGTTFYTNPSQQTIAGANYQPPLSQDMCYYKNNMIYANTTTKQQAVINFITVPTAGDTITIGTTVYTAGTSQVIASGEFLIGTGGTVGQNIDATARSLVRVINGYTANTAYYAVYTSGYTSLPGQITLQEREIGGSPFYIRSSNGTVYSPQIPSTGTSYASSNNVNPHYIYVSKVQEPDAVPLGNYIPIGTSDKAILRILALRDSVFVFKQDGVYRILGTDITNFVVSLFDSTVILTAPDSAILLNNQIFCFSNQGVVSVSDSGTVIMSRAIERDLITLSSALFPNFLSATFGIRYESDRHYVLGTPTNTSDTNATQLWVYNILTQCWTNWPMSVTAGIVSITPDDHLYLMRKDFGFVTRERKNWNNFDFADLQWGATVTAASGLIVSLTTTVNAVAGYSLYQVDGLGNFIGQSIITAVLDATRVQVTDEVPWIAGAAVIYQPIFTNCTYCPVGGNFAWVKHFGTCQAFFRSDSSFSNLNLGFVSDFDSATEYTQISPLVGGGWGSVPWGQEPWGGTNTLGSVIRTLVPVNKARAHWLSPSVQHSEANSNFALTGMNIFFNMVSERTK